MQTLVYNDYNRVLGEPEYVDFSDLDKIIQKNESIKKIFHIDLKNHEIYYEIISQGVRYVQKEVYGQQ